MRLSIVLLHVHAVELRLDPVLHLIHLSQAMRNLEAQQVGNDASRPQVLVKVDHLSALLRPVAKQARRIVAKIDEYKLRQDDPHRLAAAQSRMPFPTLPRKHIHT